MSVAALDPRVSLDQWADRRWRLSNLYWITDESGRRIKFEPNDAQIKLLDDLWYLNIILKARQRGFCLDPSTKVLTADLRWVPIGELQPGRELVAVDENPPGGRGKSRKMRTAVVHAAVKVFRKAYRVTFDDGRSVVCTGQHPWLSRKVATDCDWRAIDAPTKKKLTVGTRVRWVTKPWGQATAEDGWFGGMLDGEGSISKHNSSAGINVSQRIGPVWNRLVAYCESRGYSHCIESDVAERLSKYGKVPVPKVAIGRMNEMFRIIGQTRPTRFIGNHFWDGRELPGKRNGGVGWATIIDIMPLPEQSMVDLQTSTGTYIAEGFVSHNTTFIDILGLDLAVFKSNQQVGIIAHGMRESQKIFKSKVKFPYDNLPEQIREAMPPINDSQQVLSLANGSSVEVGTSMRSGTVQFLHVSEFGKISRRFPDKALEIVTGSFNAVHPGQMIFVESTAEGRDGHFYRMVERAQKQQAAGTKLTEMDFRFHFFPWWEDPRNVLDPDGVPIDADMRKYFAELKKDYGIDLRPEQMAWYSKKAESQGDFMKSEYPSHAKEAFQAAIEGAIYGKQMATAWARKRIREVPLVESMPVNTFWDLGRNDMTAIWFHQFVAGEHRFIHYHEDRLVDLQAYVTVLDDMRRESNLTWGVHYLPHDANNKNLERNESRVDRLVELGIPKEKIKVVKRTPDLTLSIEASRRVLPMCYFDQEYCAKGIEALENYQYEYDEKTGTFRNYPLHNWASNGSTAFHQFADGWTPPGDRNAPRIPASTYRPSVPGVM